MRKLLGTSLLVLALAGAVNAGNIPFPETTPTPQSTSTTAENGAEPTGGNIPFPSGQSSAATEAVLNLLGGVLALF